MNNGRIKMVDGVVLNVWQGSVGPSSGPDIYPFIGGVPRVPVSQLIYDGNTQKLSQKPSIEEAEPLAYVTISPVTFKLLFTSAERLAIKSLKASDPIIEDFYEIVEDPRLETVDFNLQSVRDGVAYLFGKLVEGGTLTQEEMEARLPQIFAGEMV